MSCPSLVVVKFLYWILLLPFVSHCVRRSFLCGMERLTQARVMRIAVHGLKKDFCSCRPCLPLRTGNVRFCSNSVCPPNNGSLSALSLKNTPVMPQGQSLWRMPTKPTPTTNDCEAWAGQEPYSTELKLPRQVNLNPSIRWCSYPYACSFIKRCYFHNLTKEKRK